MKQKHFKYHYYIVIAWSNKQAPVNIIYGSMYIEFYRKLNTIEAIRELKEMLCQKYNMATCDIFNIIPLKKGKK